MKIKRWHGFVVWASGTLAAIALIGEALYAGAAIALLCGATCGVINWYAGRESPTGFDEDVV